MLEQELQKYFPYNQFRTGQKEVILTLLSEQDTLAVLPTGTGKSLCYQLTGYLREGLVLVVSPLISLMDDQVLSLLRLGEKRVTALNSTLSLPEKEFILNHLSRYKFLFLSPEMLMKEAVIARLQQQKIALFVVDEAHCVSQWGIDFRPEYRNLGEAKCRLGSPLTLAMTASATAKVRQEISQLLLDSPKEWLFSMDRPNIALIVEQTADKLAVVRKILSQQTSSGIIYCATRKQVEFLYHELVSEFSIGYYHGGLENNQRRMLQQQFLDNQLQFLIATNAFGMGINKADVHLIIHYELPDSLENYLQEIGRAGRDGQQSYAILLYQTGDEKVHHFLQKNTQEERETFELQLPYQTMDTLTDIQKKWFFQAKREGLESFLAQLIQNEDEKKQKLAQMLGYIHYEGCRRHYLLQYFEEKAADLSAVCCDFHGAVLPELSEQKTKQSREIASWQEILLKMFKEIK